jgi:hypothetical protein
MEGDVRAVGLGVKMGQIGQAEGEAVKWVISAR